MVDERNPDATTDDVGEAVSIGDGSLGGAALGGSVIGPEAGVIQDPVGDDVAIPLGDGRTEPGGGAEASTHLDTGAARGEPITSAGGDVDAPPEASRD